MAQPISRFFEGLGFPLRNVRWSWGARSGPVILLRTWDDHFSFKDKEVVVLQDSWFQVNESFGLDERINQLRSIWSGEATAYTVMARVKDRDAIPREIKDYRDDAVFFIERLRQRENGDLVAVLGGLVAVADLNKHSTTHKTESSTEPFPVDSALVTGASTDGYKEKIPAIRDWLIQVCQRRAIVTYSEVMDRFGLTFYPLRNAMSRLGHECRDAGEPIITAVIVNKDTLRCSEGLQAEFGVEDDQAERERCYAHWAPNEPDHAPAAPPSAKPSAGTTFEEFVRRFSQVELRPHQAKFRDAVFRACGGKCIVSGCDVPEALEAAHLEGRDWRAGHNDATDGVLLRRDLHALYDSGLLRFKEDGTVTLDPSVLGQYGSFQGVRAW